MKNFEYWRESLSEILDQAGIAATSEQIDIIAKDVAVSADLCSEYTGEIYIPNPLNTEIEKLKNQIEAEKKETEKVREQWVKNICRRRNCSPSDVFISYDGEVEIRI